ncbi:hypothetical protein ACFC1R_35670 [Kitasatospora sp. NPDC056138]|uniref:hypothetical protein n=1 Tax=Kitasatospora sp. NPDC056138 TaxID=3345724 RepID=UPI0035DE6E82
MSRTIDIDFGFRELARLDDIVSALLEHGIEVRSGNRLFYMDNSDGLFDWQYSDLRAASSVMSRLSEVLAHGVDVGFGVSWGAERRAGSLLVLPERRTISFIPDSDSPRLDAAPDFMEFGWYLDVLTAVFAPLGLTSIEAQSLE